MTGLPVRAPHPALAAWAELRASGATRAALVTLARTAGGSSRPIGTRLVLTDDGRVFGSTTIGGCADGRARAAAERRLRTGGRELLTVPLGEEDAVALGLGCAGDVDLLVETVATAAADAIADALDGAADAMDAGVRAVLVTPLDRPNGKLLVREDGATAGSLGGADVEAGERLGAGLLSTPNARSGVHVAGDQRWLVELLTPPCTVLIVGVTEIAAELCAFAAPLGWRTVVIDPRDDLLATSKLPDATEREAAIPADVIARRLDGGGAARIAVVVVAHDYRIEIPVLRVALHSDVPYVGVLGSRRRAAAVRDLLAEAGLGPDRLARLRMPVGLAIGAQTAAEIALSIAAELVAVFRDATPGGHTS